jgi:hypothetical protein
MIEGPEDDDRYRMVEDEFLMIAQRFTTHLHAAEYQRMKAISKSQNADAIRDISRPVVGRMTSLVKKKQDRRALAEKQSLALKKAQAGTDQMDGDATESENDSRQNSSLFGLMESPRKQATRLDRFTATSTTTRASAGFGGTTPRDVESLSVPKNPLNTLAASNTQNRAKALAEIDDDTEDDDLDMPVAITMQKPRSSLHHTPVQSNKPKGEHSSPRVTVTPQRFITSTDRPRSDTRTVIPSKRQEGSNDREDDFLTRLKDRRESYKNKQGQRHRVARRSEPSASTQDIMPGFL